MDQSEQQDRSQDLTDQLAAAGSGLDEPEQSAYWRSLATAVQSAQGIAPDSPQLWPPVTSALLSWLSTTVGTVELATALVNAARVWARWWADESQVAAFADQLQQ